MTSNYPQPYRLTFDDAVTIWRRSWAGEYQHNIAATYGVNPGRVNEVLKERKYPLSKPLAASLEGEA